MINGLDGDNIFLAPAHNTVSQVLINSVSLCTNQVVVFLPHIFTLHSTTALTQKLHFSPFTCSWITCQAVRLPSEGEHQHQHQQQPNLVVCNNDKYFVVRVE